MSTVSFHYGVLGTTTPDYPNALVDKFSKAVEKVSSERKEYILSCLSQFSDWLTDHGQIEFLVEVLESIPHERSESLIPCARSFLSRLQNGYQIAFLLRAMAVIPQEQQQQIIACSLPFVDKLRDDNMVAATVVTFLASMSDQKRANIVAYALSFFDKLEKGYELLTLLEKLAAIPDEQREHIMTSAQPFLDKLDHGTHIAMVLRILNAQSIEKREFTISFAKSVLEKQPDSFTIVSLFQTLDETSEEERREITSLLLYEPTADTNHEMDLKYILFWKNFHECFHPEYNHVILPEGVRHVVQYLESKKSLPKGHCIVCDGIEDFQMQFQKYQGNFTETFAFLVRCQEAWRSIVVRENVVICTDGLGKCLNEDIRSVLPPAFRLYDCPIKRQKDRVSCWTFAIRDAVELLRMEDIRTCIDQNDQLQLPNGLLKSMQSRSYFNDILHKNVTTHKQGVCRQETWANFLDRHKKPSSGKEQNSYIEDRREKYMLAAKKRIDQATQTAQSLSLQQFSSAELTGIVFNCVEQKYISRLQTLLPLTARQLPSWLLLKAFREISHSGV